MKSQSLIVQFILFFLIGFSIFLAVGNIFKFQFFSTQSDIIDLSLKSINSYISSAVIVAVDSCKTCDTASISLNPEKTIAGSFYEIKFDNGLNTSTDRKYSFSSIHLLNNSITIQQSKAVSVKPISLMFERTKNNLVVSQ